MRYSGVKKMSSTDYFERAKWIQSFLGEDWLSKLEIDPADLDSIPAYELAERVCNAFAVKYPAEDYKLDMKEREAYEKSIAALLTREETIKTLMDSLSDEQIASCYLYDYKHPRAKRSISFYDLQTVVLNQARFTYSSLSEMISAIRRSLGGKTAGFSNQHILNHILYAVKNRIIEWALLQRIIGQYGKKYYIRRDRL